MEFSYTYRSQGLKRNSGKSRNKLTNNRIPFDRSFKHLLTRHAVKLRLTHIEPKRCPLNNANMVERAQKKSVECEENP